MPPKKPPTEESLEADLKGARTLVMDKDLLLRLPDKGARIYANIERIEAALAQLGAARKQPAAAVKLAVRDGTPSVAPTTDVVEAENMAVDDKEGEMKDIQVDDVKTVDPVQAPVRKAVRAPPTEEALQAAETLLSPWNVTRKNVHDMRPAVLLQIELVSRTDKPQALQLLNALDTLGTVTVSKGDLYVEKMLKSFDYLSIFFFFFFLKNCWNSVVATLCKLHCP